MNPCQKKTFLLDWIVIIKESTTLLNSISYFCITIVNDITIITKKPNNVEVLIKRLQLDYAKDNDI